MAINWARYISTVLGPVDNCFRVITGRFSVRKVVVFNLVHRNHFSMIEGLYRRLKERNDVDIILTSGAQGIEFDQVDRVLKSTKGVDEQLKVLNTLFWKRVDVFFDLDYKRKKLARPAKYVQVFHGNAGKQTSSGKAYSFNKRIKTYDYLFCLSRQHAESLKDADLLKHPSSAKIVGFMKLDDLVNGVYERGDALSSYGVGCDKTSVLYLPSFNDELSLEIEGLNLLESFSEIKSVNFMVKLHPNSCDREVTFKGDTYTWATLLLKFSSENENIFYLEDQNASRYMSSADILVSDFGSSPTEFMVTDKPVVFYDTQSSRKVISDVQVLNSLLKATHPFATAQEAVKIVEDIMKENKMSKVMKSERELIVDQRFYSPGDAVKRAYNYTLEILDK